MGTSASGEQRKSVLVVEDDADIREVMQLALESEGYSVVSAANGREALEKLARIEAPGLILLDLMMPVMNGMEFLAARQQSQAYVSIPVVVVSAFGDLVGSAAGANAFLRKPIDLDSLLDLVRRSCGQGSERGRP